VERQDQRILAEREEHQRFAIEHRDDAYRTRLTNITPEMAEISIQEDFAGTQRRIDGINKTTSEVKEMWEDFYPPESQSQAESPQEIPKSSQSKSVPQAPQSSSHSQESQPDSQSTIDYVLEKQSESLPDYSDDLD